MVLAQTQAPCDFEQQPRRVPRGGGILARFIGDERRIAPHRLAVSAPEAVERPPGQRLAGIPLPLAEVRKAAWGVALLQSTEQLRGDGALVLTERGGVPFRCERVLARHEGGLAAHGETHVAVAETLIHLLAESID